jgi:hypothetical protein
MQAQLQEELSFKPTLLTRIFMEGGAPLPANANYATELLWKSYAWIFVFMLSVYFAAKITSGPISVALFNENNADADFGNPEPSFRGRYKALSLFTLIFIIFVLIMHICIMAVIYSVIAMWVSATAESMEGIGKKIHDRFMSSFWRLSNGETMQTYMNTLLFVLFGVFAIQLIYFVAAKGYYMGMMYPDYVDRDKSSAEEHAVQTKYVFNYGLLMTYTLLFLLGLFMMHHLTKPAAPKALVTHFFLIFLYAALFTLWIGFELEKNYPLMVAMLLILLAATIGVGFVKS